MSLTAETLKGMWAGLPTPWTDHDQADEDALRENVRRICRAGAHGVYTHGTTGEFYAQTIEEWQLVARATVEESKALGVPSQVGCTALWTAEVVRRMTFAHSIGADAVQIAFPFWLPLTDDQAVRFLQDVTKAVPGMPIVIYNTERSRKPLTADLLSKILDAEIPVIGCKGVRSKDELKTLAEVAPSVSFFVGEYELAPLWKHGARGSYSSFVYACPRFMLRYFRLCEQASAEAERIAEGLTRMIYQYVVPRLRRGMYDTAFDRTFASMTGFLTGLLLRSRPPYDSATPKDVEDCRQWCAEHLPEFIHEV